MAVKLNENKEIVEQIREGLKRTGGYCPCRLEKTEETKCMCKEFRDQIKDPEFEGYCQWTRVQEIMEFARKIQAKRIGIANCIGLIREARMFARILQANGFEAYAVTCKVAGQAKSSMGIPQKCEQIGAAMCNPILQARLLNEAHTDLNVVIGLCVGHDSLFYKYSDAYVTTLVTKDRVTGNNPVAALYTAESYYKKKFFKG